MARNNEDVLFETKFDFMQLQTIDFDVTSGSPFRHCPQIYPAQ